MPLRFPVLLLGLTALTAAAQDAVKTSPDYKIEIDNAWVRVLRAKYRPHEKIPLHAHPAFVAVFLTDEHLKITGADGQVRAVNRKAGESAFSEATRHAEENVSDQPFEAIVIELKPGAPKSPPIALDPVKLDPAHHLVPIENDRVRVLHTVLEPHVKSPMHEHPHYVVVYLTELHTTMKLADGRVVDNPRKPGEIAWREVSKHQTEQMGDKAAVKIQVEIK